MAEITPPSEQITRIPGTFLGLVPQGVLDIINTKREDVESNGNILKSLLGTFLDMNEEPEGDKLEAIKDMNKLLKENNVKANIELIKREKRKKALVKGSKKKAENEEEENEEEENEEEENEGEYPELKLIISTPLIVTDKALAAILHFILKLPNSKDFYDINEINNLLYKYGSLLRITQINIDITIKDKYGRKKSKEIYEISYSVPIIITEQI
jgi:hypothetical protein